MIDPKNWGIAAMRNDNISENQLANRKLQEVLPYHQGDALSPLKQGSFLGDALPNGTR